MHLAECVGIGGQDAKQSGGVLDDNRISTAERLGNDHRGALGQLFGQAAGDLDGFDITGQVSNRGFCAHDRQSPMSG